MAEGAARALQAEVALGITGIAGPSGGTPEKPVGLVHWAVVRRGRVFSHSRVFSGDRSTIQRRAALSALWSIRAALLES
jgi:PncC family amidohydrolase